MIKLLLLLFLAGVLSSSCVQEGGTDIPNELVGKEFIAGKSAVEADIKLVPVGFIPGGQGGDSGRTLIFTSKTDAQGRFYVKNAVPGQYNILASKDGLKSFRDSIAITGKGQELASDTLKAPCSLTGIVQLEPQDDPQSVTVQVLGSTTFVNVDQNGLFSLTNLGAGQYRLRIVTTLNGYVPLYKEFTLMPGRNETLIEPLRPFYSSIPVVKGLSVFSNGVSSLKLSWNKSTFTKIQAYLVYRDSEGVLLPSEKPIVRVTDTFFIDTLYSRTPVFGQHSYMDSLPHSYTYRVKILDKSANIGPSFGFVEGKVLPPRHDSTFIYWKKSLGTLPRGSPNSLVVFNNEMWLLYYNQIGRRIFNPNILDTLIVWSSPDGISWKKRFQFDSTNDNYSAITVFRNKLWIVGQKSTFSGFSTGFQNIIWSSSDGVQWVEEIQSESNPSVSNYGVSTFQNRLWLFGRDRSSLANYFQSSADGLVWKREKNIIDSSYTDYIIVPFLDRLWSIGWEDGYNSRIFSTMDGSTWTSSSLPEELWRRSNHALTQHREKLWLIGGGNEMNNIFVRAEYKNDVWSSPDGLNWQLMDLHAPFEARAKPLSVSFQGKLWVMGGVNPYLVPSGQQYTDIWYLP